MSNGPGTGKGRVVIDSKDWEALEDHLTIIFDHDKDRVEIGWACDCGEPGCSVPHTTLVVYVCPKNPCPKS